MTSNGLNVIVPLGKLPTTFKVSGHSKPLPLVNLLGRPVIFWILDRLHINREDVVWLIVSRKDELLHQINETVGEVCADLIDSGNLKLIETHFLTRGVLETIYVALQYMSNSDLERRTICINGDTIFDRSILDAARRLQPNTARCYLSRVSPEKNFKNEEIEWIFCDVSNDTTSNIGILHDLAPDCTITGVSKFRGSECNTNDKCLMIGAHSFGSALYLREVINDILFLAVKNTDFSFSFHDVVIHLMHSSAYGGTLVRSSCFLPIKTPRQLENIISNPEILELHPDRTGNFIFQMYGGIIGSEGHPRQHVVAAIKMLKRIGHRISIASQRGSSKLAVKQMLFELDELGIEYDNLNIQDATDVPVTIIGANYVDVRNDINGELGLPRTSHYCEEAVKARHFNEVLIRDDCVMKMSSIELLEGEAFYYTAIPPQLTNLFPELLAKTDIQGRMQLKLSRVQGTTFSQLLVNRCVSPVRLRVLLDGIHRIHSCESYTVDEDLYSVDYYTNYTKKVMKRFETHRGLYDKLSHGQSDHMVGRICSLLDEYNTRLAADVRDFIHGDPVFSNCLITQDETVVYIDMNGKIGEVLTTRGDCAYDLAKILQSLYGYDYILLDVPITAVDEEILTSLRTQFYEYVQEHYERVRASDLRLIAASLFLSLIPLHDNDAHLIKFWEKFLQVSSSFIQLRGNGPSETTTL